MVGVARIELATPAMSTQIYSRFLPLKRRFSDAFGYNNLGTNVSLSWFLPHFYRIRFRCRAGSYTRLLKPSAEWPELVDG